MAPLMRPECCSVWLNSFSDLISGTSAGSRLLRSAVASRSRPDPLSAGQGSNERASSGWPIGSALCAVRAQQATTRPEGFIRATGISASSAPIPKGGEEDPPSPLRQASGNRQNADTPPSLKSECPALQPRPPVRQLPIPASREEQKNAHHWCQRGTSC
jgi:hypothetical protein